MFLCQLIIWLHASHVKIYPCPSESIDDSDDSRHIKIWKRSRKRQCVDIVRKDDAIVALAPDQQVLQTSNEGDAEDDDADEESGPQRTRAPV